MTRHTRRLALALAATLALSLPSASAVANPGRAEVMKRLVSPKKLLDHSEDLALTTTQIDALEKNERATKQDVRGLRATLERETRALTTLLDDPSASKAAILEQSERVMDAERSIKRRQLVSILDARATLDDRQRGLVIDYLAARRAERTERRKRRLRKELEALEQ